jgi:3-keto-5-aminohexanoate cleavage enzyme
MNKTIIEAAISGFGGKGRNPHNPVTPDEVATDILACIEAGAGVLHNHIDDYMAIGSAAAARYGEGWKPVLAARPDAILYGTVAGADESSPLAKYSHVVETVTGHGARMGALDTGSVNLAAAGENGLPSTAFQIAYVNSYALIDQVITEYARHKVAASIAVYDPSFLRATIAYLKAGRLAPGTFVKLYFGGERSYLDGNPGLSFGLSPTIKALDAYLEMMEGIDIPWAAAVLGGDLLAVPGFVQAVLERGGHLRVGLEDYAGERQPSNAELVSQAAEITRSFGRPVATAAETAKILGLPR